MSWVKIPLFVASRSIMEGGCIPNLLEDMRLHSLKQVNFLILDKNINVYKS